MSDDIFSDPRWASIYDVIDGDRDDLDHYESILDEFGAQSVLDVGCGTGVLACRLAARGMAVVGVDPAAASLAVARAKPGAEHVTWIEGDVSVLPAVQVDAATITGNAAQVFLDDDEWMTTLEHIHRALRPAGMLAFEVRDPQRRVWRDWAAGARHNAVESSHGRLDTWTEVLDVSPPFVSFRNHVRFADTGEMLTSDSTLRFRERTEIEQQLDAAGFDVVEVRDAPDRPDLELVFIAQRRDGTI